MEMEILLDHLKHHKDASIEVKLYLSVLVHLEKQTKTLIRSYIIRRLAREAEHQVMMV